MVAVTDPRLGETVLDPASGTGGFLIEAYNHLAKQVKTVADRKVLHQEYRFERKTSSVAVRRRHWSGQFDHDGWHRSPGQ